MTERSPSLMNHSGWEPRLPLRANLVDKAEIDRLSNGPSRALRVRASIFVGLLIFLTIVVMSKAALFAR